LGTNEINADSSLNPNNDELIGLFLAAKNSTGISVLFLRKVPT